MTQTTIEPEYPADELDRLSATISPVPHLAAVIDHPSGKGLVYIVLQIPLDNDTVSTEERKVMNDIVESVYTKGLAQMGITPEAAKLPENTSYRNAAVVGTALSVMVSIFSAEDRLKKCKVGDVLTAQSSAVPGLLNLFVSETDSGRTSKVLITQIGEDTTVAVETSTSSTTRPTEDRLTDLAVVIQSLVDNKAIALVDKVFPEYNLKVYFAATDDMITDATNKLIAWINEIGNGMTLALLGDNPEVLNKKIVEVMRTGIPEADKVFTEEPRAVLLGSPIALWPFLVHRPHTGHFIF